MQTNTAKIPKRRQRYKNVNLTDKQVEQIREKVKSEISRIKTNCKDNSNYLVDKNELSDPLDEANANILATEEQRFRNRELLYLKKLQRTLDRTNTPIFGECTECGLSISMERLQARPTAEECINCKEESERKEQNSFMGRKSKSLGKTIQLNSQ